MGMSTHVKGFRPPDEKWKKMKAAWDACEAAGTAIPKEVLEFFDHEPPDSAGVEIELEEEECCAEYRDDCRDGFEIDVTKLPKGLTLIRFYNSY